MKTISTLRNLALVGALSLALLTGCTAVNSKVAVKGKSDDAMLQHAQNVLSPEELKLFKVPYKINAELKRMAWDLKDGRMGPMNQARKIALHLLQKDSIGLGIEYARNQNLTAIEVYKYRQANCISYTNLFIGLAREIGLRANYIEVTEVDTFSKINGTVVYNSHICAAVYTGPEPFIIDFSLRDHRQYHSWRTISDLEAAASMYNNMGSYHYLAGNGDDSRRVANIYYDIARKLYPEYAQVYNNMGVIAMRDGKIDEAEAYFNKSLELRPEYFAGYQNLSTIYMQRGQVERAIEVMEKAVKAEPRNQYAFVNLAKLQIRERMYDKAEVNLKQALDIEKTMPEARHVLSKVYILTDRPDQARKQLALALEYDKQDHIAKSKMKLIEELALSDATLR